MNIAVGQTKVSACKFVIFLKNADSWGIATVNWLLQIILPYQTRWMQFVTIFREVGRGSSYEMSLIKYCLNFGSIFHAESSFGIRQTVNTLFKYRISIYEEFKPMADSPLLYWRNLVPEHFQVEDFKIIKIWKFYYNCKDARLESWKNSKNFARWSPKKQLAVSNQDQYVGDKQHTNQSKSQPYKAFDQLKEHYNILV